MLRVVADPSWYELKGESGFVHLLLDGKINLVTKENPGAEDV